MVLRGLGFLDSAPCELTRLCLKCFARRCYGTPGDGFRWSCFDLTAKLFGDCLGFSLVSNLKPYLRMSLDLTSRLPDSVSAGLQKLPLIV